MRAGLRSNNTNTNNVRGPGDEPARKRIGLEQQRQHQHHDSSAASASTPHTTTTISSSPTAAATTTGASTPPSQPCPEELEYYRLQHQLLDLQRALAADEDEYNGISDSLLHLLDDAERRAAAEEATHQGEMQRKAELQRAADEALAEARREEAVAEADLHRQLEIEGQAEVWLAEAEERRAEAQAALDSRHALITRMEAGNDDINKESETLERDIRRLADKKADQMKNAGVIEDKVARSEHKLAAAQAELEERRHVIDRLKGQVKVLSGESSSSSVVNATNGSAVSGAGGLRPKTNNNSNNRPGAIAKKR